MSGIRQTAENAIAQQARRGQIVLFFVGGVQLIIVVLLIDAIRAGLAYNRIVNKLIVEEREKVS